MRQFNRLGDDPLTSPDGRHVLRYDGEGVATLTDTATGEIRWRAGGSGTLLLGYDGVLHIEDEDHRPLWTPEVRAALAAMGSEDVMETAYQHDLELLCRTAGVRVTVADVTGSCRFAVDSAE